MALASLCGYDKLGIGIRSELQISRPSQFPSMNPFGLEQPCFELPGNLPPAKFVESHFGDKASGGPALKFLHGTTTLAFSYKPKTPADKGGVVVAVDSRASGGSYVASKTVMKILQIDDHLLGTMAGGAADCQFWIRQLAKQARLYQLKNKQPISVAAASKLLSHMMYNYRGMGLSLGSSVCGFDKTGPTIYYVDSDGQRVKGNIFSVGSGSLNAYGILDSMWKPEMTDEEAKELGRRAIMHATYRDTGSGGRVTVAHITEADGIKMEAPLDTTEMYYEFMKKSGKDTFDPKDLE